MDEPWDFEFVSRFTDGVMSFLSEFLDDWTTSDMRVAIFKILFGWLVFSLVAIHFAWKVYGTTVNDMYYRQGIGGQNGGTPDTAPHLSSWESASGDGFKTHQQREQGILSSFFPHTWRVTTLNSPAGAATPTSLKRDFMVGKS